MLQISFFFIQLKAIAIITKDLSNTLEKDAFKRFVVTRNFKMNSYWESVPVFLTKKVSPPNLKAKFNHTSFSNFFKAELTVLENL